VRVPRDEAVGQGAPALPKERGARSTHMVLLALAIATAIAVQVGGGNVAIALAPSLLALLLYALWLTPLRVTMLFLLGASWAIESPVDVFAAGRIHTPWEIVGRLLWSKLNLVVPFSPLVVTGFDLVALFLLVVVIHRHVQKSAIDRTGWVDAPSALSTFALLSVVAVLWMSAYGLARGGSFRFVLWQSVRWLYLPLVYALMKQGLRGVQDAPLVGKVVLAAGLFKGLEAIFLRLKFPSIELMSHATSHHDSVLFAACVAILMALVVEVPTKRSRQLFVALVPIYLWAMVANNRRLVWSEVGMVAVLYWLMTPALPLKRKLARLAVYSLLPLLLYGRIGWNSQSALFSPVQKVRSMVDADRDASTLWRDLENFNLISTFADNPVLGSGFGHPFVEHVKLPDVTAVYELEPYVPHNSVLGLWAFGGLFGFSLLWVLFPVGVFFTVRAYRWAQTPMERVTALSAAAVQVCYLMQGYFDLGFGTWGPVFTVAASYALVGKICIANGAWGAAAPALGVGGGGPPVLVREAAPGAPRPISLEER
jgi:O-Antigen ligase